MDKSPVGKNYIERVAEFNRRSSRSPILHFPSSCSFHFGSDSVPCLDFLFGQCYQVPHEFVQIE